MTTEGQTSLKSLPLEKKHEEAGAQMLGLAGWSIPAHYGNPEEEYRAAREAVALMDVSHLTKVTATGGDHVEYLNRRLSQRVIDQVPGQGRRANQLNGEGRMEADFVFYRVTEELSLLLAPPTISGDYLQTIADKFVFTEDAQFEDRSSDWAAFALLGPKGGDIVATPDKESQIAPLKIAGQDGYVLRAEFLLDAIVIMVPAEGAEAVFTELAEKAGGKLLGFLAFDTLRVEAGQPWYGIDLNERSIPLEADLMSAIHTNKGCYPGQETIAKILNLGHPARKLVGISWESEDPLPGGTALKADGREAGLLTSSSYSPRLNKAIGLAMVRWNYREAGTELSAEDGTKGRVVTLPFA